ncbi:MAG: proton-conducting transporter membrane subunit [Sulfuriferula sp.]
MDKLIVLLVALPLLTAFVAQVLSDKLGRRVVTLSVAAGTLTFALAVLLLVFKLSGHDASRIVLAPVWGSFLFDSLTLLMAVVISGISLMVHIYSVRYMAEDPGYRRFFVLLDVMTGVLLLTIAAGDLITLLVGWHLIGVVLFFLLSHNSRSQHAYRYGFWTFIAYRFGDMPMVLAAILLYRTFGTWSLPDIFQQMAAHPNALTVFGLPLNETVAGLIALSAFARSAQFLLHTWLPYTMDGPTPVSALMHAGIVNAGAFIINRFAPVFVEANGVLHWVFLVGLVTAVIGSVLMLSQNDIKKALGYSTMGQMGFMIMECGVGAFSLAIFHLIAHGLFKGTLFLGSGGVIGKARHDDGVPKDDLYTFVIERRPTGYRQPWILMAAITLAVPALVFGVAHWLVTDSIVIEQGAIILLFFGWVTGAQLLFSIHRMDSETPWRLVTLAVFSLTLVVFGYTFISHAFDLFLYPDAAFRARIYAAAGISQSEFYILVGMLTAVIVFGWTLAYRTASYDNEGRKQPKRSWLDFYALVSRELYIADVYALLGRGLIGLSARLNLHLRGI